MGNYILKGTRLKYNGVRYYDGSEITIAEADITDDIRQHLTPVQNSAPKPQAPEEKAAPKPQQQQHKK